MRVILLGAAASDHEAAALLAEYTRKRQQGQGRIASSLAHAGALRPGGIMAVDICDLELQLGTNKRSSATDERCDV